MFEVQVIELLTAIKDKLESIDTALTDVVHVIEENTEATTGAMDQAADRIAEAMPLPPDE